MYCRGVVQRRECQTTRTDSKWLLVTLKGDGFWIPNLETTLVEQKMRLKCAAEYSTTEKWTSKSYKWRWHKRLVREDPSRARRSWFCGTNLQIAKRLRFGKKIRTRVVLKWTITNYICNIHCIRRAFVKKLEAGKQKTTQCHSAELTGYRTQPFLQNDCTVSISNHQSIKVCQAFPVVLLAICKV